MPPRRSRPSATPAAIVAEPQLPEYQRPSAPLSSAGQQALKSLQNQNAQVKLDGHFNTLKEEFPQSAYNSTSSLAAQEEWMNKRRDKFGAEDTKYNSRTSVVEALSEQVQTVNLALESKLREVIDAQNRRQRRRDALKSITENITRNDGRSVVAATQSTLGASQFRSRPSGDDADGEDEEPVEPTTPNAGPGVAMLLRERLEKEDANYGRLSLGERYANHENYIEFRQMLHEGKYVTNEAERPVMPQANTWFDENGPVFTNASQNTESAQDDMQDGSDVEAIAENINMKCPITLMVMKDPVKSRKCPHNFERSAIESILGQSTTRTNGRYGQRTVQCPVCVVMLTADDLVADASLKRRIERVVASQTRVNGDSDEEFGDGFQTGGRGMARAQTVDSLFEPNLSNMIQVKEERTSGVRSRRSVVPATQTTADEERPMRPPIEIAAEVDVDMANDSTGE